MLPCNVCLHGAYVVKAVQSGSYQCAAGVVDCLIAAYNESVAELLFSCLFVQ